MRDDRPPPVPTRIAVRMAPEWMSTTVGVGCDALDVTGTAIDGSDGFNWMCVVDADDLDEAIRTAGRWPAGAIIEIRPAEGS